jgi:dolichyl-diphosphooligosaccharide--protein glycosyltransferase
MTPRPRVQWALFLAVFLTAVGFRVVPQWQSVFGDGGVDLQGGDAYYHLRSIDALIANFPRRPGFDPYALYPGGQNVPTGPFFDYAVAATALVLGGGAPSQELVEQTAAWFPPIFGALAVLPVFLLGRALFGAWAGLIGAAWIAVCPGHTIAYAGLGFADHHIFEALFYGFALWALAMSVRPEPLYRIPGAGGGGNAPVSGGGITN